MVKLLYLTGRNSGVSNASEDRMIHRSIQQLLESLERHLAMAFAQATSLAGKVEAHKKYLHSFGHLADPTLDPSLQAMMRKEATSSRDALLRASSELAQIGNCLAFGRAALERDLSKFKVSANRFGEDK
jgi:hypothetical protein